MKKILQIHFPYKGPFGNEMSEGLKDLANSINDEPGFIWKIWTEDKENLEAGGLYLFENEESATAYFEKHSARLKEMGIHEFFWKLFDLNIPLSEINKASFIE